MALFITKKPHHVDGTGIHQVTIDENMCSGRKMGDRAVKGQGQSASEM